MSFTDIRWPSYERSPASLWEHHRSVLSAHNPPPIISPHKHIECQLLDDGALRGCEWRFVLVQAGPPNTCASRIWTDEAKGFQSEARTISVLSRVGCQPPVNRIQLVQAEDNLALGATPDHIFAENTVKEIAVRGIDGMFQSCDHRQYCIPVPSVVPLEQGWRLWQ
jgi:hypothetical protein